MSSATPTVLIVPGLREHVPDHWQTLLAAKLPRVRSVAPLEQDKLSCAARVDAVDRALAAIEGPVIIVARSAGVMMVAHWAALRATREIRGALLAAPADVETPMPPGYPTIDALRHPTAGCRSLALRCRFRASSRQAATIRSRASIAPAA
jgi:predicted alpha/beta hydrolase family esterase